MTLTATQSMSVASEQPSNFSNDWDDLWQDQAPEPWLHGFVEQAAGIRLVDTELNKDISLLDTRVRLETDHQWQRWTFTAKGDIYYDGVLSSWREQIRELNTSASFGKIDIKLGRQILTWGTGDFVFLNDLFAKDWQSFFSGRRDEYLKSPTNSIKISYFNPWANIDVIWVPEFTADNYINGDYFSYYDRTSEQIAAPSFLADLPNQDELALRLFRTVGRHELALYAYDGFYKSPNAINTRGQFTFSRLQSIGGSWRGPIAEGLAYAETSYYFSRDDSDGDDPSISNSQWRWLVGYEREIITRLTGSLQFYLEHTQDYNALINRSLNPTSEPEENRTLVTTRLNWRNSNDKLTLGFFLFYSPSDRDSYTRASANYRLDDHWQGSIGINWFSGQEPFTFFGQFEENNNLYVQVRYNF